MASEAEALLVPATADAPFSDVMTPLLNDMYQITMAYTYWKDGRHNDHAVFDLFFRTPPFKGEFTIFAGLEEVLRFTQTFRFAPEHIAFLKTLMPRAEDGFWAYLSTLDCSAVRLYAAAEGTLVFPRVPLIRVEGPLGICQLLETTLLNACNFASLVATNAARFRLAAGEDKRIIEMGLRRAQGPDGAMSASRYAYLGGVDATSNVAAGMAFGIPLRGTHAHSLVCAYTSVEELSSRLLDGVDIVALAQRYKEELGFHAASQGEMAAFVAFAQAFPDSFLALVDTYDTLQSGVPNFICVALALLELGHTPAGIRLDSGDLAYLSKESRRMFRKADERYGTSLAACSIVASNDINEAVLLSLADQGHEIDTFGIGTKLVTCSAQPALGMVYKLVEINGQPRIKISQESSKITLPACKDAYRLVGGDGVPILDLLVRTGEAPPAPGRRLLCRAPFDEVKRVFVTPSLVIPLLRPVWVGARSRGPAVALRAEAEAPGGAAGGGGGVGEGSADGEADGGSKAAAGGGGSALIDGPASAGAAAAAAAPAGPGVNLRARFPTLEQLRGYVKAQLKLLREDHLRPLNPTPYKVSVSPELYHFVHDVWMREIPVPELS